jgi:hypothetical protein
MTISNKGNSSTYGIAIISFTATRNSVVDNVVAEAVGSGGTGHFAAYMADTEPVIKNSTLLASGATGFGTAVNAAFVSLNSGGGGFPQALIMNSRLIGGGNNAKENCTDPTGTGFGMSLSESSPMVIDSYICGGHRGIAHYINGHAIIHNSIVKVSSTGSAFLFEMTASGSISLANSGISYIGNKFTGAGTGLRCIDVYDTGTFTSLSDGTTEAAACD